MVRFGGFPPGTIDFLRALRANNNRPWFESHRDAYEDFYVEPAKAFVVAAGELLGQIAPGIRAEPRILGSIFRINRDTRFSKDKRPYKDYIDCWFWEGDRKRAVSGFFVRFSPDLVGIGAGCHGFDRDQLAAFRRAAQETEAARALRQIAADLEAVGFVLGGGTTLAKRSALYVHVDAPAEVATGAGLLDGCVRHWRRLAPLHRWLVDHVQEAVPAPPA